MATDICLKSADKTDLEGDLNADDFLNRNYEEVRECTLEVIEESIEGWCLPEYNSCEDIDKKEIAIDVLNDFRRAGMLSDELYNQVMEQYTV